MKKFLLFSILILCSLVVKPPETKAQTFALYSSIGKAEDTLANTETIYLTTKLGDLEKIKGDGYRVSFGYAGITDTQTFKVILQSTIDNVTWLNHFMVAGTDGQHCDTASFTAGVPASGVIFDAHPEKVRRVSDSTWVVTNAGYATRLRLKIIGGKMNSTRVWAIVSKAE